MYLKEHRMKEILITLIITFVYFNSYSQTGSIEGTIKDTISGDWLAFANVVLLRNSNQILVTSADINGKYVINEIVEGNYSLKINYVGYPKLIIDSIQVNSNDNIIINILFPPFCKYNNKDGICPVCNKKDKVIPIVYGYPGKRLIKNSNKGNLIIGGCMITGCDPDWYCKRDENEF